MKTAGAQNIHVRTEGKAQEQMNAKAIAAFEGAQEAGVAAQRRSVDYGQMAQALEGFKPGATGELRLQAKRFFKDLGFIGDEGVSDAETFKKITSRLAVHAAPKGQGSTSNYERTLFRDSVPNMGDSPEAVAKAIDMARRLDEYDVAVAKAYRDNAARNNGVPNYVEVANEIAAMPPPLTARETSALESLREKANGTSKAAPQQQGSAASPRVLDVVEGLDNVPEGVPYRPEGSPNKYIKRNGKVQVYRDGQ
jgi:hypothetical protein